MPRNKGEPSDRFTFYFPLDERASLERIAEREDRSLGYILREAAKAYAKNKLDNEPALTR